MFQRQMQFRSAIFLFLLIGSWSFLPPAFAATVTLTGTVIDETEGKPIAGAKVELSNANAGTGYFVTHTDASGRFSFASVRSGLPYDLGVLAEGFCVYEMSRWEAPANQQSIDLKIPLIRGAVIRGAVVKSDGTSPLANAKIELHAEQAKAPSPSDNQTLFTDAKGAFSFPQLPPNVYSIAISLSGYVKEQLIGLRPQSGEVKEFTIKMFRPASISGTVTLAEDKSPLANLEVVARGGIQQVGTTDHKGFFSISDLRPGSYKLECRPAGFRAYSATEVIQLKEGQSADKIQLSLTPLPPAMNVNLSRDVFLPDQDLIFQVRTFRIGRYESTIYRLPVSLFSEENANVASLTASKADLTPFTVALRWNVDVDLRNPYVWIDQSLKAPERLKPGAYILQIASPSDKVKQRVLFFVTELGIVTKVGEKKTMIYAVNLRTSMPVPKAKVLTVAHNPEPYKKGDRPYPYWTFSIQEAEKKEIPWMGETDKEGIYITEKSLPDAKAEAVAMTPEGHIAVSPLHKSALIKNQESAIFVYTDRPLYRPGQSLFYKAIFRDNKPEGYEIPSESEVKITIHNPEGETIFTADQKTNEWGSANSSFTLPPDLPLGQYQVIAQKGSAQQSASFYVEEYRKPEFKVTITPEKPSYVSGEEMRFSVRAEYYFGAPVLNASVKYRFYESVASGEDNQRFPSAYTQFLSSGEAKTDAEGITRIEFTPKRSSSDRKITLETDVEEASGRRVSASESVPMGVGKFYISAHPKQTVFSAEGPIVLDISTRDHSDKPLSVSLQVEFTQEVWSPVRRRYVRPSRPLANIAVKTDDNGRVSAEWQPDADLNGRIEANVIGQDDLGNTIVETVSFWRMSQNAGSFDYQYASLEGVFDKDSYQPGEEAVLLINTQYPENPVILTIEGRDILSYRMIWPSGKTTRVKIPILPSYAPNVYVGLLSAHGKQVSNRVYNLSVPVRRGEMKIELISDKAVYKPGETGTVKVKTTKPDGSPTAAEVSLAVVDEAIFALRSDQTPDVHNIFYGKQANWVTTSNSFPMQYFGGADKGFRIDARKDFKDTAEWIANIHTDANGEATVSFRYPENLTTWRLTSRGHTKATEVGWTKSATKVTKELVARLTLPRFFVEGDTLQLPTLVNNLSKDNLPEIQTRLQITGGVELKENEKKTTQAAAGAMARELWNLNVSAASSEAVFRFEAVGKQDSDALELNAPALASGYAEEIRLSQKVAGPSSTMKLGLPQTVSRERSRFTLTLTPSLASVALGAIPYLTEFPYGCSEQTLNGYLPSILLMSALDKIHSVTFSESEKNRISQRVQKSLTRLYAFQNPDNGGWRWWDSGVDSPHLTALVVHGLKLTQKLGYTVDENHLQQGIDYLNNFSGESKDLDTQALVLYVLSDKESEDQTYLNELHANREQLSDFGLAVGSLALFKNKMTDKAKEMRELLLSHLKTLSDQEAAWDVSPEQYWEWDGTQVETAAWGLLSILEQQGPGPIPDQIAQWLISHRKGQEWGSTRETGAVVLALSRLLEKQETQSAPGPFTYKIQVNGTPLKEITVKPEEIAKPVTVTIDSQSLKPGVNDIQLEMNPPAGFWALNASLFHPGELSKSISHEQFAFTRLYERAIHTKDYRGRPKILAEGFSPDDALDVGQEILVTLVIEAKRNLPYMIVEDPLPSGCEVIESFLKPTEENWKPYSHVERRDQKTVFFLENIPAGETRIEYLIRTELAGSFRANPTHAWCMYYPEISARSATAKVKVK